MASNTRYDDAPPRPTSWVDDPTPNPHDSDIHDYHEYHDVGQYGYHGPQSPEGSTSAGPTPPDLPDQSGGYLSEKQGQSGLKRGLSHAKSTVTAASGNRFTYIDEDFNYYPSANRPKLPTTESLDAPLVDNAASVPTTYQNLEYSDPYDSDRAKPVAEKPSMMDKVMNRGGGKYPLAQRIEDKKRGIGRQRYPIVVWALTLAMVCVFIYECVVNTRAQGTPVSFKPTVNPMLGPSQSALINLGARFPPCMKSVVGLTVTTQIACLNDTANPPDRVCSLEEVCGFGGFHGKIPDQWFRFITPIFLHAGFVHIILNMVAQLSLSAQIEREMGSGGFLVTYFAAGIFGNVLGGNFALVGAPSIGASGAIFGTLAVTWVDLFTHWKYHYRPGKKLMWMTIELLIGIAVGYIPFVDNFAHLGGFLMGLLVGTTFYPVISTTRRHKAIIWAFRLVAMPLAVILFVVLIRNFYTSDPYAACSGCRYLSCFPTTANNHCKGTGFTTTASST